MTPDLMEMIFSLLRTLKVTDLILITFLSVPGLQLGALVAGSVTILTTSQTTVLFLLGSHFVLRDKYLNGLQSEPKSSGMRQILSTGQLTENN